MKNAASTSFCPNRPTCQVKNQTATSHGTVKTTCWSSRLRNGRMRHSGKVCPPLECWVGTRPSQADSCRPFLNSLASPIVATRASAVKGPIPMIARTRTQRSSSRNSMRRSHLTTRSRTSSQWAARSRISSASSLGKETLSRSSKPRPLRGSARAVTCTTPPSRYASRLNSGVSRPQSALADAIIYC